MPGRLCFGVTATLHPQLAVKAFRTGTEEAARLAHVPMPTIQECVDFIWPNASSRQQSRKALFNEPTLAPARCAEASLYEAADVLAKEAEERDESGNPCTIHLLSTTMGQHSRAPVLPIPALPRSPFVMQQEELTP